MPQRQDYAVQTRGGAAGPTAQLEVETSPVRSDDEMTLATGSLNLKKNTIITCKMGELYTITLQYSKLTSMKTYYIEKLPWNKVGNWF